MIRGITSAIVLFAVAGVLLAGPCLACVDVAKHVSPCCDPAKCKKVTRCDPAGADLAVAHSAVPVTLPAVEIVAISPAPVHAGEQRAVEHAYSPPPLFLLNSVLNI